MGPDEYKNIGQYDSLIRSRAAEFEYTQYDIGYTDSLLVGDSTVVIEKWSLHIILYTFTHDKPNYIALARYLDYFDERGIRLVLRTGYNPSIPNIEVLLASEIEQGYRTIWLTETSGCTVNPKVVPFIDFMRDYGMEETPKHRKCRILNAGRKTSHAK